jgi:hypothetical protein
MAGIGDNLHERAIVRELARDNDVWVRTSWPQIYWDMPQLKLLPAESKTPWMVRNERNNAGHYCHERLPAGARRILNGYLSVMPDGIKQYGSVLGTMAHICEVPPVDDFRMPIKPEWYVKAHELLRKHAPSKPLLIYRPPMTVLNWRRKLITAKVARNPELADNFELISSIREKFFVISLANCTGFEELAGPRLKADLEFHRGELSFETMAALTSMAALVFCSPGFACVLAQAVGTPSICVFGGFEGKESFSVGAQYAPWLPIEPINPCACWSHGCEHDKKIDVGSAKKKIDAFIAGLTCKH